MNYTRNQVLLDALQAAAQVDVVGEQGKSSSILWRSLRVTIRSLPKLLFKKYDLVVVGFYGHFIMLPVGLLSKSPILFDAFVSTYDTLIEDRQIANPSSIVAKAAFLLDKVACHLATRILLDTQLHVDYFINTFHLPRAQFNFLPVGCDEKIFSPGAEAPLTNPMRVLYYCTYLPLHGTEYVIQAASLLCDSNIEFRMIGNGREFQKIRRMAEELEVKNIRFIPPVSLNELAQEISQASICLCGHFGTSEKSRRVIAGKTYQCIAMGKPVVVGENPANQELLTHNWDAWFCPMGNAEALAASIRTLAQNPELRKRLGEQARQTFIEKAGRETIHRKVKEIIQQL